MRKDVRKRIESLEDKVKELEGKVPMMTYWDENKFNYSVYSAGLTPGSTREIRVASVINAIVKHFGLEIKHTPAQFESVGLVKKAKTTAKDGK